MTLIAEPKYKYGQQEQVTARNYNRSTALERSVLKYWGGLNRFYGIPTSPSASVMAQNIQLFGPIKFGERLSKFMIPIDLLEKFGS